MSATAEYTSIKPHKVLAAYGAVYQRVRLSHIKLDKAPTSWLLPYRSEAPAYPDLLGGAVEVMFGGGASIEYIRVGKLRPLAVTTATRSEALPEIPTVGDFVPGYEESSFFGLCSPRNTPGEIIGRLNAEINVALADPKMKANLTNLGGTALIGRPADFGKLIADETEKRSKVLKFAGFKPE